MASSERQALRKRAKPLLGTLVEVSIQADSEAAWLRATDAAFARIADVQRLMSFHEADSDLRALSRSPAGTVLSINADTWLVLHAALEIETASGGLFNAAVAPELVGRGLLPTPAGAQTPIAKSLHQAIALLPGNVLEVRSAVWVDLGGIAKGYAVDAAVAALQARGVKQGIVNAGGDLRVFGPEAVTVHVRQPGAPGLLHALAQVRNAAVATSCRDFSMQDRDGAASNALIDPLRRRCESTGASVSVMAPTCMLADALTKVVMFSGDVKHPLLAKYGASAVMLEPQRACHA